MFEGNIAVLLNSNRELDGGAILAESYSKVVFRKNSISLFYNNLATIGGGAIKVLKNSSIVLMEYTTINFTCNSAQYGAAIFMGANVMIVKYCNNKCINFTNKIAEVLGNFLYQDLIELCNKSCLMNKTIIGISNELIATPPNELKIYDSAICMDNANDS